MFEKIADKLSRTISQAWFFATCVMLIIVWAILGPFMGWSDTHQLIVNTATTIITFLMVSLLQNSQQRGDDAIQQKLDVLAKALSDLMEFVSEGANDADFTHDIQELREAVGLERESIIDHES